MERRHLAIREQWDKVGGSGGILSGRKYSGLVLALGRVLNEKAPLRICGSLASPQVGLGSGPQNCKLRIINK